MIDTITLVRPEYDTGTEKADATDNALDDPAGARLVVSPGAQLTGKHHQERASD
jgi:hypothetical protein